MFLIISYVMIFLILAALAYRDVKEYILPDYLNAALALSFMSFHILHQWQIITPLDALWGAVMGGGLLFAIRAVANKIYDADALGLGDVKLMAAAGLGLGHPQILLALVLGSCFGVAHGVGMSYFNKTKLSTVNVPAGLGLTLGIGVMVIYRFGFAWMRM